MKKYESAELILLMLSVEDVLTASNDNGGEIETDPNELPII